MIGLDICGHALYLQAFQRGRHFRTRIGKLRISLCLSLYVDVVVHLEAWEFTHLFGKSDGRRFLICIT